jgi:hypothetical protein
MPGSPAETGCQALSAKPFSYTSQYGYIDRLLQLKESLALITDPLWLTAVATLITSVSSLIWALRRKR